MNNQNIEHIPVELPVDSQETAERNVGFLIHDTARQLRTNYDRRMRELGLTRSQWWVLTHLYFNEGLSQTNLSDILEIERATLGRLLDRLEAKGWIERRTVPKDRRVKLVFLARAVEPLLRTMRALAADVRSDALAELSETEQEQFITTLIKIKGNLTAMDENANAGKNRDVLSTSVKDGQNG
ncbi:MAG: MarR family transcriptional regulator [Rhodospirillaceae bacterium]|jgi:MarR family transcriptional regulator, transcriptional regulator for hemolysin|nr:MarR family transcriptional regulator [Rhodospirillaceae bacterium]MBT5896106.1 MarR family transcriptional regulator [Rhodospirillaceae bacterium]MBT6427350.1 MarR family transcriptional regulator [Rhodospirillaceae bacterium]MBT7757934.1 MarR family transcriptional regulator [Rhodospirillaceae bacterium]